MRLHQPSPDHVATALAFVSHPDQYDHLDPDEWAILQHTAWAILRNARPPRDQSSAPGDTPPGCTVLVIPRAIFESHARPSRHLPPLRPTPSPKDVA